MSLRSTELVDASAVAGFMGGGGHLRAAGYSVNGDRDAALGALIGASEMAAATIETPADADSDGTAADDGI